MSDDPKTDPEIQSTAAFEVQLQRALELLLRLRSLEPDIDPRVPGRDVIDVQRLLQRMIDMALASG